MTILEMKRVSNDRVRCAIEHQGHVDHLDIRVEQDGGIRSFRLVAATPAQMQLIHNSAYASAFARRFWQLIDGAEVRTPVALTRV